MRQLSSGAIESRRFEFTPDQGRRGEGNWRYSQISTDDVLSIWKLFVLACVLVPLDSVPLQANPAACVADTVANILGTTCTIRRSFVARPRQFPKRRPRN